MELWKDDFVQGERYQRDLAIRTEDTGHVSKLRVKTLFISKNFQRSFRCIVGNCNILQLPVVLGHFAKPEFTPAIFSLSTSWEVDNVH